MRKFKIKILGEAVDDFEKAFDYYQKINPIVAKNFFTQTDNAFKDLKKNSFYQIRYDEFRMKIVKKFPYIIHYIVDQERSIVYVYGIRNSFQSPKSYPKK